MEYYTMLARQHFGYQKIVPRKPLQGYLKLLPPDILDYDYTSSEGYPNGQKLTDDTVDIHPNQVLTNKLHTITNTGSTLAMPSKNNQVSRNNSRQYVPSFLFDLDLKAVHGFELEILSHDKKNSCNHFRRQK
jgi:hypothetical protein